MIRYRYNPNASGMPAMETAEVHGAEFRLWLNSDQHTNEGKIEEDDISPELLKAFEKHGYITILDEVEL